MFRAFCHLVLLAGLTGVGRAEVPAPPAAPVWWTRLETRDLGGEPLAPAGRWIVCVFLSPECPVANAALPVLNTLAREFGPQGFAFVGVYADPTLPLADLRRQAAASGLAFATLDDRAQRVARWTGATYTPEVFVYAREGTLLYRGRIDDRAETFGAMRPRANREDLREVLAALLAGASGPFAPRPGFGCTLPEPVPQ